MRDHRRFLNQKATRQGLFAELFKSGTVGMQSTIMGNQIDKGIEHDMETEVTLRFYGRYNVAPCLILGVPP